MNADHSPADGSSDDELQVLAGEYVLGTLDAVQRRAVALRLPYEPRLRSAVEAWEVRLHPLTALVAPEQPSDALWPRIAASTVLKDHATRPAPPRWWQWQSLTLWRGLAGTSFSVAAVLCALLLLREPAPSAVPRYFVVLAAPQSQAPGWLVQAHNAGELRLIPISEVAVPTEKSLQFWTKADDWSAPVSLGLVNPGEAIEVPVDRLPPLQPNQLFELTLEPAGGSPSGRPTGPIQFIGRAVQL